MPRTWEITDEDGGNRRTVIMAAVRAGDLKAVEEAQAAMRARFPK